RSVDRRRRFAIHPSICSPSSSFNSFVLFSQSFPVVLQSVHIGLLFAVVMQSVNLQFVLVLQSSVVIRFAVRRSLYLFLSRSSTPFSDYFPTLRTTDCKYNAELQTTTIELQKR
ncbi:hypothetical protein BC938DRAFT_483873, partial [Jimgerdemannia flammicorona]